MASNQGEESGDQNPNQDQGRSGDQNQNQGQDQDQSAARPWLRITPVPRQIVAYNLPIPPFTVPNIVERSTRTEPHQILQDEIPRPANALDEGQVQAYAQGYEPKAGEEGDTTEWVHGQTYAHERNLPRRLRLMLMARNHPQSREWAASKKSTEDKERLDDLTDEEQKKVQFVRKKGDTVEVITLKQYPILPRHISNEVEGWRMFMWMQYDKNISFRDIYFRIRPQFRQTGPDDNPKTLFTYLVNRVERWTESAKGGQFSREERKAASAKGPSKSDKRTAANNFPSAPEGEHDENSMVSILKAMSRSDGLNKIYWNTPWSIFKLRNANKSWTFLVQQPRAKVKNAYFRADGFRNDPEGRERVFAALWAVYMESEAEKKKRKRRREKIEKEEDEEEDEEEVEGEDEGEDEKDEEEQEKEKGKEGKERRNNGQDLDEFHSRNFEAIAMHMRRLDLEHQNVHDTLNKLKEQEHRGPLEFNDWLNINGVRISVKFVIDSLTELAGPLGLDRTWRLDDTIPANVQSLRATNALSHAIVNLWTGLYDTLEVWNKDKVENLKFNSIKRRGEPASEQSGLVIEHLTKDWLCENLVRHCQYEINRFTQFDMISKGQRKQHQIDLERRLSGERFLCQVLCAIKWHAGVLGLTNVFEFVGFPPESTEKSKFMELKDHIQWIQIFFLTTLGKTNPQKEQEVRKRWPNIKDEPGRNERFKMIELGEDNIMELGDVGNTPIDPYGKNPSFDELFEQQRLNRELDRVLGAHKRNVSFPQDKTTFFQRLHYVLDTLKFEDVLGHLRISKPVIEFLSAPDHSKANDENFKDASNLARAVNVALVNARYRRTTLDTTAEDEDYKGFFERVVYTLGLNDQDWARNVGENLGRFKPTEADLDKSHQVGESPTKMYSRAPSKDMWSQERLRKDIQDVLTAHGRDDRLPEDQKSACDFIRLVLQKVDFKDLLGHYRVSNPVLYILRHVNLDDRGERYDVHRLAQAVDDAMLHADVITESNAGAAGSDGDRISAVAEALQDEQGRWVARVRQNLKSRNATGGAANGSGQRSKERWTIAPITPGVGDSPIEGGGYGNLYQADGSLNRARFNYELDRVLRSHEYTANFGDDEVFEDRIEKVLNAGFLDVLGHNRILAPIVVILRTTVDDSPAADTTRRLAFSVDQAIRDAAYMETSLVNAGDDTQDSEFFNKLADKLEEIREMWTAQVRFTLRNNADYALSHPKDPRPRNFQRLF